MKIPLRVLRASVVQFDLRALRAVDQKSNRPKTQIQNNFHANSPGISLLIKICCAPLITKAQHRAGLTEGQHDVPPNVLRIPV